MKPLPLHSSSGNGSRCQGGWKAFTLIEILAASAISAMIFLAIYGVFQRATKMRDNAMERTREAAVRERAISLIRNDLRNGYYSAVTGGIASTLTGNTQNSFSRFPGYLGLTTTTGKAAPAESYGDVQLVEYYIGDQNAGSSAAQPAEGAVVLPSADSGTLIRSLTRDLISPTQEPTKQETVLTQVASFEASFYDGSTWQPTWVMSGTDSVLPQAVRVNIQQAAAPGKEVAPAPIEITVPWTIEPLISSTTATTGSTAGATP